MAELRVIEEEGGFFRTLSRAQLVSIDLTINRTPTSDHGNHGSGSEGGDCLKGFCIKHLHLQHCSSPDKHNPVSYISYPFFILIFCSVWFAFILVFSLLSMFEKLTNKGWWWEWSVTMASDMHMCCSMTETTMEDSTWKSKQGNEKLHATLLNEPLSSGTYFA